MEWLVLTLLVLYGIAFTLELVYLSRYRAERTALVEERERDLAQAMELSHTLHQATHTPVRNPVRPPYPDLYQRYADALDETRDANERLDDVIATSGAAAPEGKSSPFVVPLLLPLTLPIYRWKREGARLQACLASEAQPVHAVRDILNEIAAVGAQEKAQIPVVADRIEQARTRIRNECRAERTLDQEKQELARCEQAFQTYTRLIEADAPAEEQVEEAHARRVQLLAALYGLEKQIARHERLRDETWGAYAALDRAIVWLEEQILAEAPSHPVHYLAQPAAQFRQAWRDNQLLLEKGRYEQARQQIETLQQELNRTRSAHQELRNKQQWIRDRVSALHNTLDVYQDWIDQTPKEFRLDASTPLLADSQALLVSLYQFSELDDPVKVRGADEVDARLRAALAQLEQNRTDFDVRQQQYLARRDGLSDDAIGELVRRAEKCKEELGRCHAEYLRSIQPAALNDLARDLKKEHGELRVRLRPVLESKFDLILIQIQDWCSKRDDLLSLCANSEEIARRAERDREQARSLLKDRELVELLRRCRTLPRDWDKNQVLIKGFDERYRQCSAQAEREQEDYAELVRSVRQLREEIVRVATAYDEEMRQLQELLTLERGEPMRLIDSLTALENQAAFGLGERARRKQVELRARLAAIPALCKTLHEGQALREQIQELVLQIQPEVTALHQEKEDLRKGQQIAGGSLTDAAQALARYVAAVEESSWSEIAELSSQLQRTQARLLRLDTRRENVERRLPHSTLHRTLSELHEIANEASDFCAGVDNQRMELTRALAQLDDLADKLTRGHGAAARLAKKEPTREQAWDKTDAEVKRCWQQARQAATLRAARAELSKAQASVDEFRLGI